MRRLSDSFLRDLKPEGVLSPLTEAIRRDADLLLETRENYVNVYFKGHSVLKLDQHPDCYPITLHSKFRVGEVEGIDSLRSQEDTDRFVRALPFVKERVLDHQARGGASEIEWEQLLIRANNNERRANTEYFIVDRQVVPEGVRYRFDLVAIRWPREGRKRGQTVPLVLLELKYGLNSDIARLAEQLARYYEALPESLESTAKQAEILLRQKIELGLIQQPPDRLSALTTLRVSPRKEEMRLGVVLVDYNPGSTLFKPESLAALPFADRLDLFFVGFGLWGQRASALSSPGAGAVGAAPVPAITASQATVV